jgi:hypothetical protein
MDESGERGGVEAGIFIGCHGSTVPQEARSVQAPSRLAN